MHSRLILAGVMLLSAVPVCARTEPARLQEPPSFEQRVVAIMNAGGTTDTIQGRLSRVGAELVLTADQRVAIDALRTLVRARGKSKGLPIAEAEAFAERNPASPASAMLIAEAALTNDQPERSADMLIAAAARAGSLVQLVSPATVSKLSDELDALSDRRRTADLAKALLYAGWGRGSASLRSYLALAAIRDEVASGRVDQARRLLPVVKNPASLHLILIDNRLAPLRSDVERIAGPRLERAWQEYLTAARDEWFERGDALSAVAYAEALKQANQYDVLAAAFLARFMRGYNCPSDMVARSVAADLAESLVKIDRWTRAEDVLRRSGGISPPLYAAMLLERGDFGRAGSLFERSLKSADAPESKKDQRAMTWLQAASDCAAFQSGNRTAASGYDPKLLDVSARLFVLLCLDRAADARAALIAALDDDEEREDALRWVQPFNDPLVQSKFREVMNERIRVLQRDPDVVAAVSRYGSILDWPLISTAPAATEMAAGQVPAAWQCGDQADWETTMPQQDSIRLPDSEP
jgi:hypothetical protein